MRALKLKIISAQQTAETIVINNRLSLTVEQGATYKVIDAETNELVMDLVLKKQGDALVIESANEVVVELIQFYNADLQTTFDVGIVTEEGSPNLITSNSPVNENSHIVWQENDASIEGGGFTTSEWLYMGLGGLAGVAAIAGGIVAAVGGGSSSELEVPKNTEDNINVDIPATLTPTKLTITSSAVAAPMDENSGAAQVIYMATVLSESHVSYSLKEGAGNSNLFTINSNTGEVALIANADYEALASYSFTVVATDAENNFQERAVSLAINNLDEIAPVITSNAIAQAIGNNSGAGQVVYQVTSIDTTDTSTGLTEYELKGGDAGLFSINNSTGEVVLNVNPDYEVKDNYHFTVIATDAANNVSEQAITLPVSESSEVDSTVVVFDLLNGVSSSHSEREFDLNVSYDIYIQVDSGRAELNIPKEESDAWGVWHAWDKLSSDDHIIFVGSNGVILGEENLPIVRYAQFDNTYYLQTATFTAIAFNVNGNITRVVDDNRSSAILGDNVRVTHSINQLPMVNLTQALSQRPDVIWTTQGLL